MPCYRQRFAYERFFLDADDEDPELEAYLDSLLGIREERYRSFLAFWAVCGLQAMAGGAQVIDAKKLALDTAYRQSVEAALADTLGRAINLRSRPATEPARAAWLDSAHRAASDFVRAYTGELPPNRMSVLLGYLGSDTPCRPVCRPKSPPERCEPEPPRTISQRAVTLAAVLAARAIQPIRRLNGALTRPRSQIT